MIKYNVVINKNIDIILKFLTKCTINQNSELIGTYTVEYVGVGESWKLERRLVKGKVAFVSQKWRHYLLNHNPDPYFWDKKTGLD